VAHLAAIGRPHLRSPTSASLSKRQRPSASGVRRHSHCPRLRPQPRPLPTTCCSLESSRGYCPPQQSSPRPHPHPHPRPAQARTLDRQPLASLLAFRPSSSKPPLGLSLHASPPKRCRYPLCGRDLEPGLSGDPLRCSCISHTPYATLGPVRGKRCRTGRPKIHTALGVNPLSATISSSHPTFFNFVDLRVNFAGRV
jgi:hypothetical protein